MLKRIFNKSMSILDAMIWRVHSVAENKGLLKPIQSSTYRHLDNGISINHEYPINFDKKDEKLFAHYTNYKSTGDTVLKFEHVNVSYDAIVFKGMNNVYETVPHIMFRADYGWLYMLKNYLFRKKIKGNNDLIYILIYDFWSAENYYHWLIDSLPRLMIIQQELKGKNYSLLLPVDCREFIKRTLTYYEINHITFIKRNEFIQTQQLLVPCYLVGSGHIHPSKIVETKQFFMNKIPGVGSLTKIYVSRGRQKVRKVINEDEVIKTVKQFGFEVIYFEDYTFEQQVEIGKGAKIIVSSHGANLTNILFMPEKSKVLELIRSDKPNFCYWALAAATKLNYYYQLCDIKEKDHLWVDIELFKLNLHKILND